MDPSTKLLRERLPSALIEKLETFRTNVRRIKRNESILLGFSCTLLWFLLAFSIDRFFDASAIFRVAGILTLAGAIGLIVWNYLSKTVLSTQEWAGLARLIEKRFPGPGDRLLGILEIGSDDSEWTRSKTLSQAAISQVAAELHVTDFDQALPKPRLQSLSMMVFGMTAIILGLAFVIPQPVGNAAARWAAPWLDVDRYTFAQPENLEPRVYVGRGEDYSIEIPMKETSPWIPSSARVKPQGRDSFKTQLDTSGKLYKFDIPAHSDLRNLEVKIGDYKLRLMVDPKERSSIESALANIKLPEYLKRSQNIEKDIRAGLLTMVKGSSADLSIVVDRELSKVNVQPGQFTFMKNLIEVSINRQDSIKGDSRSIKWVDKFGLAGLSDFGLKVKIVEDEKPGLVIEDLPRSKVLLESDTLDFKAQVNDDFGIKEVGMEWTGEGDPEQDSKPTTGEKLLASFAPDDPALQLIGTFSAKDLGINPQPLKVKFFVSDFYPDRERVYSPEYLFYVLNEDQHLQWITRRMTRWQQDALLVKSKEEQLHKTNKELRDLTSEELNNEETRRKIKAQASAEKANGRRLSGLSKSGENLIREAAKNSQFGPGTLENWAEVLNVLKDISGNRMPSVEGLLKEAAAQPMMAQSSSLSGASSSENNVKNSQNDQDRANDSGGSENKSEGGPMIGQNRNNSGGNSGDQGKKEDQDNEDPNKSKIPALVDKESSLQPEDPDSEEEQKTAQTKPSGNGKFGLPSTTLQDFSKSQDTPPPPPSEKMEDAVIEQEDLLAEFNKVSEEMNRILADLEGSTFVKRLKAASRAQTQMARTLGEQVADSFGLSSVRQNDSSKTVFNELKEQDRLNLLRLDEIQQDMEAYYQRKQFTKFKNVLNEMEEMDPFTGLDTKSEIMDEEVGWSFTMTEYWADTFDRWAEDLVDPASGGTCPGSKSSGSLPPSIVLEIMKLLEGEIDLRNETRVADQNRPGQKSEEYKNAATSLADNQGALRDTAEEVTQAIRELPKSEEYFANEIQLMSAASVLMTEAEETLAEPETGARAIAVETEIIELLLQAKRSKSSGGGGGGANPGGGGSGETEVPAIALIGSGVDAEGRPDDNEVQQSTGTAGPQFPEEFKRGLDTYFEKFEQNRKN